MGEKVWRSRFFRTPEEKIRILKNYGVHVLQREEKQRRKRKVPALWVLLGVCILLSTSFFFFSDLPLSGLTFFETQTQEATILVSESGFFVGNSTGTYQVDHVLIEPKIPYINNTLVCVNGSTSTDVSSLLYIWYINGSSLRLENRSTITRGNVSVHDRVECGIIPQNGTSLLAYWPFDEGTGTEFHEFVNNFSGSSNMTNWTLGRNYFAIAPNATNNFTVGNPLVNVTKNFSLEMWVYARDTSQQELYNLGGFRVFLGNQILRLHFALGTNLSSEKIVAASSQFPLNKWTHIVYTYDNTTLTLYLNGAVDNSTSVSGRLGNYTGTLYFGKDPTSATTDFKGLIDEVAIYNASLNSAEVSDHYKKGLLRLSRHYTLEIDTTQAHFANGTCLDINCTLESGNITLANSSSSAYYTTGNFTSRYLELANGHDDPILRWSNTTPLGTNLSLQVRTGILGDNGTILWAAWSGSDPAVQKDNRILLALDFSEGQGNVTRTKGSVSLEANMTNNDFTPEGKHGFGTRLYGLTAVNIAGSNAALSLNDPKNFTLEIWVKPLNNNVSLSLVDKEKYALYTNASGRIIFNASYSNNVTSTPALSFLPVDIWTHIVVTHDAENITKIYVNGTLETTQTNNGTMNTATTKLQIGGATGLNYFNGTIDSLVIYNRTLSQAEIRSHAQDRFTNSSGGESTGELNRFIRYRAFFESNGTVRTPTLFDVSFQFFNYSTFIYDMNPANVSLANAANNSLVTTANITLNWTTVNDLENDTLFYEFILANDSNFTNILRSTLSINNFSQIDPGDDNHTSIVEHFERKDLMISHGFSGNWSNTQSSGKWRNGFELKEDGQSLHISSSRLNAAMGTIEFWVRPNWNPSDGQSGYFFDHGETGKFVLNRSGSFLFLSMGVIGPVNLTYNISTWNANEWHHVAVSWQRFKNMTLYIDGVRVNRTVAANITGGLGSNILYLGTNASDAIYANATFDELRISTVAREAGQDLNSTNYTLLLSEYADNTYYWRVRAYQIFNETLDGEKSDSPWEYRSIRLDSRIPNLTETDDPIAQRWENTTSLNLTSSESTYCEYKNHSGSYVPMTFTNGLTHSQQINLSNAAGNFTYYINCNDTANQFANTTLSFYVFNFSTGTIGVNTTKFSFIANTSLVFNFTNSDGYTITRVNTTTRNNLTAKISVIRHLATSNPENTSTNLEQEKIVFWTIIPDDILIANLSENMSVRLYYEQGMVDPYRSAQFKLYYFDTKTGSWVLQSETAQKGSLSITLNTKTFGTYTLSNNPPPITPAPLPAAEAVKPKETVKTPYIGFHDEIQQYVPYEFPFARLYADEEQTLEMSDENIALFTVYFASNEYLEDVVLSVVEADISEGAYDAFTIYSDTMDESYLSYMTLESTIEKSWLEENEYSIEDMVIVDEEGKIYELTTVYEDDTYYYVQSEVNRYGTFTITTQTLAEQVTTTQENSAEEAAEEEAEATISYTAEVNEEIPLWALFLYALLFSVGSYYISQISLTLYFTFAQKLPFKEGDILKEDFSPLRNTVYINKDKDLTEELLKQGWKEEDIKRIQEGIQKLPKGKLESYIYQRLSMNHSEEEIMKALLRVGWDKKKTQKEIERFKRI